MKVRDLRRWVASSVANNDCDCDGDANLPVVVMPVFDASPQTLSGECESVTPALWSIRFIGSDDSALQEAFGVSAARYAHDDNGNSYALLTCKRWEIPDSSDTNNQNQAGGASSALAPLGQAMSLGMIVDSLASAPGCADICVEIGEDAIPDFVKKEVLGYDDPGFCKTLACQEVGIPLGIGCQGDQDEGNVIGITCAPSDLIKVSERIEKILFWSNALQNIIFAALGIFLAMFFPLPDLGEVGFDLRGALGTVSPILANKTVFDILAIIATVAILIGISGGIGVIQRHTEGGEATVERESHARHGILGEILQLGLGIRGLFFLLTGLGEEALFRAGLISALCAASMMMTGQPIASLIIACVFADAIFCLSHLTSYRDFGSILAVMLLGAVLTVTYLATGSILTCAIAHGAYDLIVTSVQQRKIRKVGYARYFHGKRPVDSIKDKDDGFVYHRERKADLS